MTQAAAEPQATGAESVLWDLSVLYSGLDDPAINADIQSVMDMADAWGARWRGRVASLTGAEVEQAIREEEAIQDKGGRIGSFAYLSFSENTGDPARGALVQRITEMGALLQQKTMFFELEWLALEDAAARAILDQMTNANYRHRMEAARRSKPYVLKEEVEQVIVEKDVTGASAWRRFFEQLTGAWRFTMKHADGTDDPTPYTQSAVLAKLYSPDQDVRRRAADAMTAVLRRDAMPITYIFNTLLADKAAEDKRRGYPSWISARNISNKAPDETVEALVTAVTSSYSIVQRHYTLKRALLGLDELFDYDRYAPLTLSDDADFYTWDDARSIVQSAYERFSPRAGEAVRRFFDERWIHAPALPGKRGGAFASPVTPSAHPFVLLNYVGRSRDVMTLAHELGHGLHMYLGGRANGFAGLYTPLTTAEMASTFGEMLTFDDLMARTTDPAARLAMLVGKVEDSFATIFRQIAMNRFEHAIHTARRAEGELTTERFSALWLETQRAMFGGSVTLRDDYGAWWGYIPHFLNTPGYVYAYAFGELLVLSLFNLYQQGTADFADRYISVLEAGDSDYPENILAKVGVDLRDPGFWSEGLRILDGMVAQEEALARTAFPDRF
jgi:oligoendopeptidase F